MYPSPSIIDTLICAFRNATKNLVETLVLGAREQQSDSASKSNIGLNLKFSKRQEEVCGYTKRTEDGQWLYSMATINLVLDYQRNFPEVFEYIAGNQSSSDMFHELDMFTGRVATKILRRF